MILPPGEKTMVAKIHRVHIPNVGEAIVHIPGGVPYRQDDNQEFPYGSYMRLGDKGFVYGKAYSLLDTAFGAWCSEAQKMGYMVTAADIVAGATVVTITVTATQNITENQLAGGYLQMFANTIDVFTRGIVSNTAIVSSGVMTVVMDSPSPVDVSAGAGVEAHISPYSSLINTAGGADAPQGGHFNMIMGMPTYPAEAGNSLWLQVSGPIWIVLDVLVGAEDGDIEAVFGSNGSISVRNTTTKLHAQHAGFIIAAAYGGGGGQGAPFLMLDIAH